MTCFSCIATEAPKADYIFFGGDILTGTKQTDAIEALAVNKGKIIFLGKKKEALYLQSEATQWINLQQGALVPGFINQDASLLFQGLSHFCTDLSPKNFQNGVKLKEQLKILAKNGPILAMGFDPLFYREKNLLTLKFLDSLSTKDPIIILNDACDIAYANTKALQLAAISKQDSSPFYLKKKDGRLCGIVLTAQSLFKLINISPVFSSLNLEKVLQLGIRDFAKSGYTTVVDSSLEAFSSSSESLIKLIQSTVNKAKLLNVYSFVPFSLLETKIKKSDQDNFFLTGVSFILDGSLCNRLASLSIPYKKKKTEGKLFYSLNELTNKAQKARSAEYQICFKASGDKAISQALACCNVLQNLHVNEANKFLIKQASLSSKESLETMARSGAYPCFSMTTLFSSGDSITKSILPTSLVEDFELTKTAYDLDTKCSISSGGNTNKMHPLEILETTITRKSRKGSIIGLKEKLSVDEALCCLTFNPALQLNLQEKLGSLELGKQADFAILSVSPKKVGANKISNIKIIETWVNGVRINLNSTD